MMQSKEPSMLNEDGRCGVRGIGPLRPHVFLLVPSARSAAFVLQTVDSFARLADSQRRSLRSLFASCLSSTGCLLLVTGYRLLTTLAAAEGRAKVSAANETVLRSSRE